MGCIVGSEVARKRGVTKATHQKRDRSWDIYVGFLSRIEHTNDAYLETISSFGRLRICGAFMHAVRRGDFWKTLKSKPNKGGTARTALDHVAAAFVASGRVSPILDTRGRVHTHIK